jgi:hypothetical protein
MASKTAILFFYFRHTGREREHFLADPLRPHSTLAVIVQIVDTLQMTAAERCDTGSDAVCGSSVISVDADRKTLKNF